MSLFSDSVAGELAPALLYEFGQSTVHRRGIVSTTVTSIPTNPAQEDAGISGQFVVHLVDVSDLPAGVVEGDEWSSTA